MSFALYCKLLPKSVCSWHSVNMQGIFIQAIMTGFLSSQTNIDKTNVCSSVSSRQKYFAIDHFQKAEKRGLVIIYFEISSPALCNISKKCVGWVGGGSQHLTQHSVAMKKHLDSTEKMEQAINFGFLGFELRCVYHAVWLLFKWWVRLEKRRQVCNWRTQPISYSTSVMALPYSSGIQTF